MRHLHRIISLKEDTKNIEYEIEKQTKFIHNFLLLDMLQQMLACPLIPSKMDPSIR